MNYSPWLGLGLIQNWFYQGYLEIRDNDCITIGKIIGKITFQCVANKYQCIIILKTILAAGLFTYYLLKKDN